MNPNPNPQGAPDTPPTQGTQQPYQQAQGAPTEQFARTAAQTAQQPKRMGLADALGSQHVKVGKYKVDYAALVTVVGAILAVIAIFLPFMSARIGSQQVGTVISGSQNMIQGSTAPLGWFLLCSFVVIAVLAVCRQEAAALTATVYSSLLSVFFVSLVARTYGSAASLMNAMGAGVQTRVNYGAGMWVLIIGIILMLIGTIVAYYNEFRANHPQAPTDDPSDAPAAPAPGYPTSDDQYQDNGWQFGTPDAQPTTSADSSDWQFGVPNAATAAVDDRGPAAPQASQAAQPAAGQQPRVAYAASQRQPQPMPQQYTQPEAAQGEQPVQYRASPASAQQYPQEMAQPARPQVTSRYTAATPDAAVTVESAGQSAQPASFEPGTMSLPDIPSIPPLTVPGTGEEVVDEHVEVTETEPTQPAQQTQPKQSGKE